MLPAPRTDREAALYAAYGAVRLAGVVQPADVTRVAVKAALDTLLALGWDIPR